MDDGVDDIHASHVSCVAASGVYVNCDLLYSLSVMTDGLSTFVSGGGTGKRCGVAVFYCILYFGVCTAPPFNGSTLYIRQPNCNVVRYCRGRRDEAVSCQRWWQFLFLLHPPAQRSRRPVPTGELPHSRLDPRFGRQRLSCMDAAVLNNGTLQYRVRSLIFKAVHDSSITMKDELAITCTQCAAMHYLEASSFRTLSYSLHMHRYILIHVQLTAEVHIHIANPHADTKRIHVCMYDRKGLFKDQPLPTHATSDRRLIQERASTAVAAS